MAKKMKNEVIEMAKAGRGRPVSTEPSEAKFAAGVKAFRLAGAELPQWIEYTPQVVEGSRIVEFQKFSAPPMVRLNGDIVEVYRLTASGAKATIEEVVTHALNLPE